MVEQPKFGRRRSKLDAIKCSCVYVGVYVCVWLCLTLAYTKKNYNNHSSARSWMIARLLRCVQAFWPLGGDFVQLCLTSNL